VPSMAGLAYCLATIAFALANELQPVVLVPGLAGSVVRAKLSGADRAHFWCESTSDWFTTWVSATELLPEQKDCTLARLATHFDAASGNYSDARGVKLDSSVDFGGVGGISELDPGVAASAYFKHLIKHLVEAGYVVGLNLHGAPYDWRMAPDGHAGAYAAYGGSYYARLKALIETTTAANNARAHLITHSLGGPTVLAFLNLQTAEWKARHIASFIPISGPWGGAVEQVEASISGNNLGVPLIPDDYLKPVQCTAASGAFLLPDAEAFGDAVLVATPHTNYSASEWPRMLRDLNLTQALAILQRLEAHGLKTHQLQPPEVPTHLLWSSGLPTLQTLRYNVDLHAGYDAPPASVANGDGDGTVNMESALYGPRLFGDNGGQPLTAWNVSGVSHFAMVSDARVLAHLDTLLGL